MTKADDYVAKVQRDIAEQVRRHPSPTDEVVRLRQEADLLEAQRRLIQAKADLRATERRARWGILVDPRLAFTAVLLTLVVLASVLIWLRR